ncbi:hypothetical protein IFM89_024735 [Coptis chinensis]|uniref:Cytochrome P450 n=1 Tax=Coptis chinensis TaxID=261450 RepID=A0A835H5Q9_9MAGN|nr:hypothetical protein IFM89_024735 [Coptis chinensis]
MMELAWPLVVWSGFYLAVVSLLLTKFMKNSGRLPPGPPGWPLIGNIFDLDAAAHHTLAKISNKYGPIVWLRLGAVNTMVVSSAEAAMDMFKNHDLSFAGRTTNEALRVHCYDEGSMALGQYGPYWRMLRRICTTELFTNSRINGTESLRMKCIDNMIRWIWDEAKNNKGSVEVARFVSLMSFNVTSNVMLSKDLVDPESKKDAEFFTSIAKAIELGGRPNIADFFPFLRWLDPQGIKRKMRCDMAYTHKFAYGFVEERILERKNGKKNTKKDFLDVLLDFQGNQRDGEPENISEKHRYNDTASTDTTTSTIEWALTELLRNPSIMRNVQAELDQVLVQNKMEEVDVGSLRYLQAVVKETLRLHPPVPLLIPRRAMDDTKFMGYSVPKDTQILVNVWAIGRDPVFWDDPLSFKPERFLSSNIDYKGRHFQFIPFGAGRRICVGMSLAHRTLHLALGSLIQSFEWALEDGVTPENMDMTERLGVALRKADPLKTVLKLRVGKYKGRND